MPPYTTVIAAQFDKIAGSTLGERERSPLISLTCLFSHLAARAYPRFSHYSRSRVLLCATVHSRTVRCSLSKVRLLLCTVGSYDSTDSSAIGTNNMMSETILKQVPRRLSRSIMFLRFFLYFTKVVFKLSFSCGLFNKKTNDQNFLISKLCNFIK